MLIEKTLRLISKSILLISIIFGFATSAFANIEAAKKWIEKEFQLTTLTKDQQIKEMEWFIKAA
ncbi:MAG: carbohydrate ABC transporter substrate-binding protein, partial [Candidatus Fonsibacter sp.]